MSQKTELEHGRVETRKIDVLPADFIKPRVLGDWKKDCECIVRATTFILVMTKNTKLIKSL